MVEEGAGKMMSMVSNEKTGMHVAEVSMCSSQLARACWRASRLRSHGDSVIVLRESGQRV